MPRPPAPDAARMRTSRPLPPALPTPFHIREARELGVTPGRLRAKDLDAPFHEVRAPSAPATVVELARAYAVRMSNDQFFSHATAALLHDMPLPRRMMRRRVVHVSVRKPLFPPQGRGVKGHVSSRTRPLVAAKGLRALAPAETWCELASELNHNELVIAADYLVRRRWPASTLTKLNAVVAEMGSRRYVRALRAALADVRPGTDSPKESELRLLIVQSGLPEPVIHFEVHDADGGFVGTPDLAYPQLKIAIEYEGRVHQTDRDVYTADIARRELLAREHWIVILVIDSHLRDHPAWTVGRIRDAIAQRAG